ncbi:MAG: glycosyltransferase family 4 protein [Candidatus Omnitrophota bacterium]|nr:glycosyltransferase family 4 protein [Candidatus Omnitrophota bacterium]
MKMRILHAPAIVVNQQWIISRAQRKLGYQSDFMAFNADRKELPVRNCDINFHFDRNKISLRPGKISGTIKFLAAFSLFFLKALFKYDVFHFHSESFLGSNSSIDLAILKFLKKKIVFQYWGCDIRLKTQSLLAGKEVMCKGCIRVCDNSRKLRDNLAHLKYADFRVYGGADTIAVVPDAIFIPIAIDLNEWKSVPDMPKDCLLPSTGAVRIVQAFQNADSRGDLKGTSFIKKAVEDLKAEGYNVEHIFLEKIPYERIKYYYQQADIVFDQIFSGWHGSVTVEAMAMAKPVICRLDADALKFLPTDHPIVNADQHTLLDKLRELVKDRQLRDEIGKRSRRYVEERHDSLKLAARYIELYEKDWR